MNLKKGDSVQVKSVISAEDVERFAEISGDNNPIHLNDSEASKSVFGRRVAHGLLLGGLISGVIGTKLPGYGTIYLEQDLRFLRPAYIGDEVEIVVTVEDVIKPEKGIVRLKTTIYDQNGEALVKGFAVVKYEV